MHGQVKAYVLRSFSPYNLQSMCTRRLHGRKRLFCPVHKCIIVYNPLQMSRMHILMKWNKSMINRVIWWIYVERERERDACSWMSWNQVNIVSLTMLSNIWHWFFSKCVFLYASIYSLFSQLVPLYPGLHVHVPFTLLQLSALACTHVQVDEHCFPKLKPEHSMEYKNVTVDLCTATLSFMIQSVKDPKGLFIKLFGFKKFYRTENWAVSESKELLVRPLSSQICYCTLCMANTNIEGIECAIPHEYSLLYTYHYRS